MACEQHAKRAAYMREWTAKNAEKVKAQRRARKRTPEQLAAARERDRRWRENNPERAKELARKRVAAYRARFPERTVDAVRRYGAKHPERVRAWARAAYHRRKINDPDGYRAWRLIDKKRRRGGEGFCTKEQYAARWAMTGGMCWICRVAQADTIDHVIPVSRGGTNWPANLRPACMDCNRRKYNKVITDA